MLKLRLKNNVSLREFARGLGLRVGLIGLLGGALAGCGYNRLQEMDENVKASFGEIQNQYQRRSDLVPNLVATVSGYAGHEKETLTAVIEARAKATSINVDASKLSDPNFFKQFEQAQTGLSSTLGKLMVVVEKYPELKANENFKDLQSQLEGTENRIAVARKRYIESVAEYNKLVRFFPTNLTAQYLLHLSVRETFQASPASQAAPQVKF